MRYLCSRLPQKFDSNVFSSFYISTIIENRSFMGLSSNVLWHQTDENGFYEILKSKRLCYSYSQERVIPEIKLSPVAFPMISVCDYPIAEIGNNKWAYGNYNIGFTQEWGVKAGFSPVWYCSLGSRGLRQLNVLLENSLKTKSKGQFGAIMYLFAMMKFVKAPLITKTKTFKEYRFYDEREWRVVPYITETDAADILPFLTEDGYKEYKGSHNGSSLLDIGVDFQYEDIHYIIVESEDDVRKTRDVVGMDVHIFTKDEVIEDMIGVDHHDEIISSPLKQDMEAAHRQLERTMQMLRARKHNDVGK